MCAIEREKNNNPYPLRACYCTSAPVTKQKSTAETAYMIHRCARLDLERTWTPDSVFVSVCDTRRRYLPPGWYCPSSYWVRCSCLYNITSEVVRVTPDETERWLPKLILVVIRMDSGPLMAEGWQTWVHMTFTIILLLKEAWYHWNW